jgi:hypothetical protein
LKIAKRYQTTSPSAALINMAGDLALARIVLSETKRSSWRYIWEEEMEPHLTHIGKTVRTPAENDPQPSTALLASLPAVAEVTEKRPEADFSGRRHQQNHGRHPAADRRIAGDAGQLSRLSIAKAAALPIPIARQTVQTRRWRVGIS